MPKVKSKNERAAVEWTLGTIGVVVCKGPSQEVEASRYGILGVHKWLKDGKGLWVVTHEPTGWACCKVRTETDAMILAECFVRLFGDKLQFATPEEAEQLNQEFPWLKEWNIQCLKERRYIPPESYMEKYAKSKG